MILALHFETGGEVRDAHRAVGRVDALPAGAARAEHVDPQILVLDLDVDLFGFREHGHRCRRGMNAALLLGHGDALHAVHARLVTERTVRLRTTRRKHRFLQAAEGAVREREDLDLPAAALGEAHVHAEQICGKQRRLVAAGAGPDLDDRVAVIKGVRRREELGELGREAVDVRTKPLDVAAGQLGQLGVLVGEHFASLRQLPLEALQALVRQANGLELGVLAAELFAFGRISGGGGVGQLSGDLLRPGERLAESVVHGLSSLRPWYRTSGGSAPRGRRCRGASACP